MKAVIKNSTQALEELKNGNARFCNGLKSVHSLSAVYQMAELAQKGQKPFAIVISCSDSRAPAETIFDQGLGDLFVIRVAGNIINEDMIASLEFAALTFGTKLCVVMGHSHCGAISASIAAYKGETKMPSYSLEKLVDKIKPTISAIKMHEKTNADELIKNVTANNVVNSINQIIENSPIVGELVGKGDFQIVGSVYDIASGKVDFFYEHSIGAEKVGKYELSFQ